MNKKQKTIVAVAAAAAVGFTAWAVNVWLNTDAVSSDTSVEEDSADVESAE